jgi:hypothetical protein
MTIFDNLFQKCNQKNNNPTLKAENKKFRACSSMFAGFSIY